MAKNKRKPEKMKFTGLIRYPGKGIKGMSKKSVIPGGFYIKARKIQQSAIQHAPPHIREVWEWLLMRANHTDARYNGHLIKRGQVFCSWRHIQEGLYWQVGYRKMRYSQSQIETGTKWLTQAEMIAATKTKRGRIITIVNYDLYQNPTNYEYRTEARNESRDETRDACRMYRCKNKKNEKYRPNSDEFRFSQLLLDLILERKPNFTEGQDTRREKTLQRWAVHIGRLIRTNKRTPEQVEAVIRWCQQDDFWQNNILSTEKLRKQIDKLELAMEKTGEQEYVKPLQYDSGGLTPRERLRIELENEKQQKREDTERT